MQQSTLESREIAGGDTGYRVGFMSDDAPRRFFDQATRDYHHALRRIQRRRTRSIANWLIVPWLIAGAVVILAVWLW